MKETIVRTPQVLGKLVKQLRGEPLLVLDTETTGLRAYNGDAMVGISIYGPRLGTSAYISLGHSGNLFYQEQNLPPESLKLLEAVLCDPGHMIGWNIGFDAHMLEAAGLRRTRGLADVMLAAHLANENEVSFGLKHLSSKYLGKESTAQAKALANLDRKAKTRMGELAAEEVAPYAIEDVRNTWGMGRFYSGWLRNQGLYPMWGEVNDYLDATWEMERAGVLVDLDECRRLKRYAEKRQSELHRQMEHIFAKKFNPRSNPQVQKLFGLASTSKDVLQFESHEAAPLLIKWRQWDRAITGYYNVFISRADQNSRMHPNLQLHGTVSGRLSCADPNLQSLPKDSDVYNVRRLVKAPPGYMLASFDYSQIELRLLASLAQDPAMIQAFREAADFHQATADLMKVDRESAKRINYAATYNVSAETLASDRGIPVEDADAQLKRYHRAYPHIKKLQARLLEQAYGQRYIELWTGRRRRYEFEEEAHKALSNYIQGGVAELMRHSITRLHHEDLGGARMLLQVHDEILFEVPDDKDTDDRLLRIATIMEDFPQFAVVPEVEPKFGEMWAKMIKIPRPQEGWAA